MESVTHVTDDEATHLIIFSLVRWDFTWQRPHSLARAAARRGIQVVFVEPYVRGIMHAATGVVNARRRRAQSISHPVPAGVSVLAWAPPDVLPHLTLRRLRASLGTVDRRRVQTVIYLPARRFLTFARALSARPLLYDRVLDWAHVPRHWYPPRGWQQVEAALLSHGRVTTDAEGVADAFISSGVDALLVPHAADDEFISYPWSPPRTDAPLGYFGAVQSTVIDLDALISAADHRPVEIVGDVDEAATRRLLAAGIPIRPPVDISQLPAIIDSWSGIILPYRTDVNRDSLVPAKLWNALASGRPVLAQGIDRPEPIAEHIHPLTPENLASLPTGMPRPASIRTWDEAWAEMAVFIQGAGSASA